MMVRRYCESICSIKLVEFNSIHFQDLQKFIDMAHQTARKVQANKAFFCLGVRAFA